MSVRTTIRRTWPVLLSYALFSLWGLGCFMASLFLAKGGFEFAQGSLLAVLGVLFAAATGHVIGNLLGLAGFRLGPVVAVFVVEILLGIYAGVALGPYVIFPLIAVFAALGGYLGIGSRLDVVASWYPLSFSVGAAVMWMNAHGAVRTFNSGEKHALWDGFTLVCLGGAVFFMLVFLATRNSLGLTVWQEVGRPRGPGTDPGDGIAVARPGRGSFLVLFLMTVAVLGTTALVSPYLFRTRRDDNAAERSKQKPSHGQTPEQGDGDEGEGEPQEQGDDGKGMEQLEDLLKLALKVFLGLLVLALILLLLIYGVLPPLRRRFLLKHLVTPLWPVAPTSRVMNLWRRALSALALFEIEPAPGEPPTELARRVEQELQPLLSGPTPGLAVAAGLVEKIHYAGRGLGPGEEQAMRAAVLALLAALEPHVAFKKKLAAAWGQTPEVEG